MVAFLLGPIVGGLSHESVNLWARADGPGTLYAWLAEEGEPLRLVGSAPLQASDGFAGIVGVKNLKPETSYRYALTLEASENAPERREGRFTTFPLPGLRRSFSFAFGSCFRPSGSGNVNAFHVLSRFLSYSPDSIRFLMLIGDQIYADDGKYNALNRPAETLEDYRKVYAYVWSQPEWCEVVNRLPVFMTMDDHEVDNDWHWVDEDRTQATSSCYVLSCGCKKGNLRAERVLSALKAYWEHQAMHGPVPFRLPEFVHGASLRLPQADPGSFACAFTYGAAAFFVMDTRSGRVCNLRKKQMLHPAQWEQLKAWLLKVKDEYPVKFLVTSSALLYQLGVDVPDRWSAFPEERDRLLRWIAEHEIEGVYFLSGDLHSAHATRGWLEGPSGKRIQIYEFCSTPFEQEVNKISRYLNIRPRSSVLKGYEHLFTIPAMNFGIIHVTFQGDTPKVFFECVHECHSGFLTKTCWTSSWA